MRELRSPEGRVGDDCVHVKLRGLLQHPRQIPDVCLHHLHRCLHAVKAVEVVLSNPDGILH